VAQNPEALSESKALSALKLAIWTKKGRIPEEQVRTLSPLWQKYFEGTGG
jgi:hypothetical protein